MFTLHDLKLFHHFLCWAHPPLPLGSKEAWTKDIPQLSHHSTHLMSALLALAASHMESERRDKSDLCTALLHKSRAMAGLREACSKTDHAATDLDVMLATCYALMFQSALLAADDSDFSTFISGCAMLTERIQDGRCPTVFRNLSRDCITLAATRANFPRLDMATCPEGSRLPMLLSKGVVSLHAAEICIGEQYQETKILMGLHSIFSALQVSPSKGYDQFVEYYGYWFKVAEDRAVFSGESTDAQARILWVFFIALQLFTALLVVDACRHETRQQLPTPDDLFVVIPKIRSMVEWLHAVKTLAPLHLRTHFVWLGLVSDEVMYQFDMAPVMDAGVQSKLAALCNFSARAHNVFGESLQLSACLANWTEDLVISGGQFVRSKRKLSS